MCYDTRMSERIIAALRRMIPIRLYRLLQPPYHFALALLAALYYRFPSRRLTLVFVTGTKGKTSVAEILTNIFEAAGKRTALLGTLRFQIGEQRERNLRKMTVPGRFFVQKFLYNAIRSGCTHAVIEMTSEGARQFRHRFIDADALIFTNLAPEHIESHGSYEAYRDAKLSIARALGRSKKPRRLMVANADDKEGALFLAVRGVTPVPYRLSDGEPVEADEHHVALTFRGVRISSRLAGRFNAMNIIAAATVAAELGIAANIIADGVKHIERVEGRMERIEAGQTFPVVVDYAHTPDSLEAVYRTFGNYEIIAVLGNTGGGRDKWKRPVMGAIAEHHAKRIILTNEDPYDEDPLTILNEMREGMKEQTPEIILDRRQAIARALALAKEMNNPAVLITGKGTDPFIMGPNGKKTPWDDRAVTVEEIRKLLDS